MNNGIEILDLGITHYAACLEIMQKLHLQVSEASDCGALTGKILITQHYPVVTMGLRNTHADLVTEAKFLRERGIDFCHVERGGSVTVHEPGQCVVYPILKLRGSRLGPKQYVALLEKVMINTCARFGVVAVRDQINPGVWVETRKVGALGIRVKNGVTLHGLALNVNNSLATFDHIVPCGIRGRGVTSVAHEIALAPIKEKTCDNEFSHDFFDDVKKELVKEIIENFP